MEKCLKTNDDARSCRSNGLTAKKALAHALRRMLMILHDSRSPGEFCDAPDPVEVIA